MAFPRRQHNATILADGKVLVTGGTRSGGGGQPQNFNNLDPGQPIHVAELWDPDSKQWTSLAAEAIDRCYHATAVLLPDATVLSAGGGEFFPIGGITEQNAPADTHRDGQVFTPPYLCTGGSRPVITSAPGRTTYGETFHVGTPYPDAVTKVTWIRLSSVTHSFNTGQRFNKLQSVVAGSGLDVTAPASANVCPPGHYMMFLIGDDGVPSVAEIVQIVPPAVPAVDEAAAPTFATADSHARSRQPDVLAFREAVVAAATGTRVVVGLTGTCPYGIAACWGGANEALNRLSGVEAVDPVPDGEASTATVFVTGDRLPSLDDWRRQFRAIANDSYVLRGIEISLTGLLEMRDERLHLRVGASIVLLGPLNPADKVQWDRQTGAPQAASTAELVCHASLLTEAATDGPTHVAVTVTGPLRLIGGETTLEVREARHSG
jgi:galactose oxidase